MYEMTLEIEHWPHTGPGDPPRPGCRWLEHLPHDPVAALRGFVSEWYADVPPPVAAPRRPAALPMPPPLAALHEVIGERAGLLGRQDGLMTPHDLRVDEAGRLIFGYENQGVFLMATLPDGDDPPVLLLTDGVETERSALPLSRFLLDMMLFEATVIGPYRLFGEVGREDVDRIVAPLRRVPAPAREIHGPESSTYAGNGLVVRVSRFDDDTLELAAVARNRDDLRAVERFRDFDF